MPRLYEDDEKNSCARLILCIVRVTGGRRSLCKFFQEKLGWDALWDDEDENMSNVVQGTTETILNKLEENLAQVPEVDESDLLQVQLTGVFSKK